MGTRLITKISRELCKRSKYSNIHYSSYLATYRTYSTTVANTSSELSSRLLQVKVTSREMIKPSSPTPRHLKTVPLSILDQLAPSYHNPMIWFYQNTDTNNHNSKRLMLLKKSLSETLVDFYPLAGRTQGNVSISCEDQGAEFCEAYVSEDLNSVIQNPRIENLRELLPFQAKPRHENLVLGVQVNHFSCGGTAISICMSHKIADGWGTVEFVRAWSSTTASSQVDSSSSRSPEFNGASFFPPIQEFNDISPEDGKICQEKLVSKRIIFDKERLEELRSQVKQLGTKEREISRVEMVSAYIWKQLMARIPEITAAVHAVNIRKRASPSIPDNCYGNFVMVTSTNPLVSNRERESYTELIKEVRTAIRKVDSNHVERILKSEKRLLEIKREFERVNNNGAPTICFTSLCRFPLYEIDFGMGKPVWACHATAPVKNLFVFWNTKCGNGVEAWIHMLHSHMLALHDLTP